MGSKQGRDLVARKVDGAQGTIPEVAPHLHAYVHMLWVYIHMCRERETKTFKVQKVPELLDSCQKAVYL